ncbi:MAG: DNA/RNA non-specific endonuclease [Pseudohongiellaceae bacterium]
MRIPSISSKTAVLVAVVVLSGENATAQNVHISHCAAGCPAGAPEYNVILVRSLYALSANYHTRFADWVSYRVLADTIGVASLLPRIWEADNLLGEGPGLEATIDAAAPGITQPVLDAAQDREYRLSEYRMNEVDLGRLVPMSSFAATPYWEETNLLSIMSPLRRPMRQGPWSRLDQAINRLAASTGEVHVITGPLYNTRQASGTGLADTPQAFFKLVASTDGHISSFVFDQELPEHALFCEQRASFAEVQIASGLDFFPDAQQWPSGSLDTQLGCND